MKRVISTALVALIVGVAVVFAYDRIILPRENVGQHPSNSLDDLPARYASFPWAHPVSGSPVDFRRGAALSTPTVVHVKKTYTTQGTSSYNPFRDFFGDEWDPFGGMSSGPREQMASGSGVIISSDGYIVTNNHVVSNADDIEVTLYDKRTYKADLIGTDPSTDLALIKVTEEALPHIAFGNSDSVEVGEWVLAVGNPFDLTSTVTAGIVSAKGRNINILSSQSKAPIESFIQTDAAVNPGNSGGALVNINGELIGINTAIATPTGTYAGYSFAVPVNIVRKVVRDLMDYGVVQRAFLGLSITDVNSDMAEEMDLRTLNGIYVAGVNEGSGADEAGIVEGDIIHKINNATVNTVSELQEQISRYRPGDKVEVELTHDGKRKDVNVVLKNQQNTTEKVEKALAQATDLLGAEMETLDKQIAKDLNLSGGVEITGVNDGVLKRYTNIQKGFVITMIDNRPVTSLEKLNQMLGSKGKGDVIAIQGIYPKFPNRTYSYALAL